MPVNFFVNYKFILYLLRKYLQILTLLQTNLIRLCRACSKQNYLFLFKRNWNYKKCVETVNDNCQNDMQKKVSENFHFFSNLFQHCWWWRGDLAWQQLLTVLSSMPRLSSVISFFTNSYWDFWPKNHIINYGSIFIIDNE